MKIVTTIASIAALLGCLVSAAMVFGGSLDEQSYKTAFFVCSLGWFAFSTPRIYRRNPRQAGG